jgi:pantothenate kinase type III
VNSLVAHLHQELKSHVDTLAARAAQLRKVELIRPKNVIGKNTVEALQSGTIFGFAGQVDGLVDRITAELGSRITTMRPPSLQLVASPH